MFCFELHHAVEVAEEVRTLDGCRIDVIVAEFAQEATVAGVDSTADAAEVADVVVGGAAVDVVNGHAGRDRFVTPGGIDGMGGKNKKVFAPGTSELEILRFAVLMRPIYPIRIDLYLAPVGIDADTDDAAVSVVDIERDTCFRAGVLSVEGYEFDTDVVEKKRFLNHKTACSEGCLFRKAVQK